MKINNYIRVAATNLIYSPLRTLLAMLGCMIGTASVVALISSGNLAAQKSMDLFKLLRLEQMSVYINQIQKKEKSEVNITPKLILDMKAKIPQIKIISPYTIDYSSIAFNNIIIQSNVIATTDDLFKNIKIEIQDGRFFSDLDQDQKFCVLGYELAKKLKRISMIGNRVRVGQNIFTVIGVAAPWIENNFFLNDVNNAVIIPLNLQRIFQRPIPIRNFILELNSDSDIDLVKNKMANYFSKNVPGYTLNIQSAKELIKNMLAQQQTFTLLLGFIGSIALLVAGIGIMNLMLASVAERHYEIALRLAIGAKPKDIQVMFLTESIMLAAIGGIVGIVVGVLATYIISIYSGWIFSLYLMPPFIGLSVSILTSMFFGFYPAYVASKLNPIEILHTP